MFYPEIIIACIILIAIGAYALTGMADLGGGVLELLAPRKRIFDHRALISRAISPIWEAHHVWIILIVVLLFSVFPVAFSAISTALFIPIVFLLIGFIFRGASFVFRSYDNNNKNTRLWSLLFSISSCGTLFVLGLCMGTVMSGSINVNLIQKEVVTDYISSWLSFFPCLFGLLSLVMGTYVASTYLIHETYNFELKEDFRIRALVTNVLVVFISVLIILNFNIQTIWIFLLVLAFNIAACISFITLWFRWYKLARITAMGHILSLITCLGFILFPHIVPPNLTIFNTAAPAIVIKFILFALALGFIILIPAFAYLYIVFKRGKNFERKY